MDLIKRKAKVEVAIFMPSLAQYDAMATHVLELRSALREHGVRAVIYADEIKKEMRDEAIPFRRFLLRNSSASRYNLYQLATGSNMVRHLMARPEPLLVQYHNITPRSHFVRWDPGIASSMAWGQRQLEVLSKKTELALAISKFNAQNLVSATYPKVALSPPLIRSLPSNSDRPSYASEAFKLLFVGRIAPNKAHEDLIRALGIFNSVYEKKAHIHFVGSVVIEKYMDYLIRLVGELNLESYVHFEQNLSDKQLSKQIGSSHLFVCASKHEGFGFPLIEAMRLGTPVVAVASSAIPSTVGNGAVLLETNDALNMAAAWHMVLHDAVTRESLIVKGHLKASQWNLNSSILANLGAIANCVPVDGVDATPLYFDIQASLVTNTSGSGI